MKFTREQIMAMAASELDTATEEIRSHMNDQDADLANFNEALDWINERRQQLADAETRRQELANRIAAGAGTVLRRSAATPAAQTEYNAGSPEYRRAYLKNLAVRDGVHLFGEMSREERDAFTFLTSNSQPVVPTEMMNRIVELVESQYPMYQDATKSYMTSGFQIPRHKAINQGDAAATQEHVANDDEQDTFDLLDLAGVEIKKHLVISRKMKWQSLDAFGAWVEQHIAERIGVAKERQILTRLDAVATGIAAANVVTAVPTTDAGIRGALAKIRGTGAKVVYANNLTIWNIFAGINDGAGNKAFIPSPTADPTSTGVLYGFKVREDMNLADNVAYFGIPRYLLANDFETLFLNHALDPKTFEDIVGGYSLFDAGLENPLAFVKVTFAP